MGKLILMNAYWKTLLVISKKEKSTWWRLMLASVSTIVVNFQKHIKKYEISDILIKNLVSRRVRETTTRFVFWMMAPRKLSQTCASSKITCARGKKSAREFCVMVLAIMKICKIYQINENHSNLPSSKILRVTVMKQSWLFVGISHPSKKSRSRE